jgi:hypothetical protein
VDDEAARLLTTLLLELAEQRHTLADVITGHPSHRACCATRRLLLHNAAATETALTLRDHLTAR